MDCTEWSLAATFRAGLLLWPQHGKCGLGEAIVKSYSPTPFNSHHFVFFTPVTLLQEWRPLHSDNAFRRSGLGERHLYIITVTLRFSKIHLSGLDQNTRIRPTDILIFFPLSFIARSVITRVDHWKRSFGAKDTQVCCLLLNAHLIGCAGFGFDLGVVFPLFVSVFSRFGHIPFSTDMGPCVVLSNNYSPGGVGGVFSMLGGCGIANGGSMYGTDLCVLLCDLRVCLLSIALHGLEWVDRGNKEIRVHQVRVCV